jgi:translation initiation factor IF-2
MAGVTVEQLAKQVGDIPLDKLIQQLQRAGITVTDAADIVTVDQKERLLSLLRQDHGEAFDPLKKISLKRTSVSELKVRNSAGKSSTVSVVSKRRRVYVKKEATDVTNEQDNNELKEDHGNTKVTAPEIFEVEQTPAAVSNATAENTIAINSATSSVTKQSATEKTGAEVTVVGADDLKKAATADAKKSKTQGHNQDTQANSRRKGKVIHLLYLRRNHLFLTFLESEHKRFLLK